MTYRVSSALLICDRFYGTDSCVLANGKGVNVPAFFVVDPMERQYFVCKAIQCGGS